MRNGTLAFGLGSAQLIAWGSLYYGIAVLAEPMQAELGLSPSRIFGAFTWSLVIAGVLAPAAGRCLDRYGGRAVLVASALFGATGFFVLAEARSFSWIVVGWSISGVAMAFGLYDTCFAAIGQAEPIRYRFVVTGVTLIGGFASTVAWPLSHYLLRTVGWRGVCHTYVVALLLCVPIYALLLPAAGPRVGASISVREISSAPAPALARARILSWAFAGAALIGGSISAHLPGILGAMRLQSDRAVWIASSIGALQVLGRVLDLVFGSRRTAAQLGTLTFAGMLVAIILLLATATAPVSVFGFAVLYGISNGLLTIARATLPVELFGLAEVGAVLGAFSAPSLVMRALAPLGFSLLAAWTGIQGALLGLAVVGLLSLASHVLAVRRTARMRQHVHGQSTA